MFELRRRQMNGDGAAVTSGEEPASVPADAGQGADEALGGALFARLRPPLASLLADDGVASREQLDEALAEAEGEWRPDRRRRRPARVDQRGAARRRPRPPVAPPLRRAQHNQGRSRGERPSLPRGSAPPRRLPRRVHGRRPAGRGRRSQRGAVRRGSRDAGNGVLLPRHHSERAHAARLGMPEGTPARC